MPIRDIDAFGGAERVLLHMNGAMSAADQVPYNNLELPPLADLRPAEQKIPVPASNQAVSCACCIFCIASGSLEAFAVT